MLGQHDLFARAAPPPPASPTVAHLEAPLPLPPRGADWERLLARSQAARDVVVWVSTRWTGVVQEWLSDPATGRYVLYSNGQIAAVPAPERENLRAPPVCDLGRYVLMTAADARALHARRPLVLAGSPWPESVRYRAAGPGEPTGAEPPYIERYEVAHGLAA
jgi:hypothetical protein